LLEQATRAFDPGAGLDAEGRSQRTIEELYAKIGQLTVERDFLSNIQEVRTMSKPDREAMLDRDHAALSIRRQCQLLSLCRSGVYRPKRVADDDDLALMRRPDELYTAHPFLGSRRMTAMLRTEGLSINRKRVPRICCST
jgi:HTH-like domain